MKLFNCVQKNELLFDKNKVTYKLFLYKSYICRSQTDCFVVSQLFGMPRYVGCFKLYIKLSILPLSHQVTYVSLGIVRHCIVAFVCLHFALPDTKVVNSFIELCIKWEAFSFLRSPGACSGLRSGAWLCKRNNGRLGAFN